MPATTVDYVDVLIVGAGPAGLMAASWMAHIGAKTRIVDKRSTKIFNGQADGVAQRTIELFDSFDICGRLMSEANPMSEINNWFPSEDGGIKRGERMYLGAKRLSRFSQMVVLHQGRIERFLLDKIKEVSDIEVERGTMPSRLDLDASQAHDCNAYPITVELQHLSQDDATPAQNLTSVPDGLFRSNLASDDTDDLIRENKNKAGSTETVKAKYVIGCDGAHSWVRRQIGYTLDGDATEHIWGVIDILPKTDFPDIRTVATIHSKESGTVLLIPREKGICRLYVQLSEVHPGTDAHAVRAAITPEVILKAAKKILQPYKLEYDYCDWWAAYQIGQRVNKNYSKDNRIFLAGDACHTHSPKAGQGMNVSMQDTFNLGWKIGLVAKGIASPSILETYQSERNWVGEQLIALDHKVSRMMSAKPRDLANAEDHTGVDLSELSATLKQNENFQSGTQIEYGHSMLVARAPDDAAAKVNGPVSKPELASEVKIGMRMPSHQVLNQASGISCHFAEHFKSDGRFRVILFAGHLGYEDQMGRVKTFCERLDDKKSFLHRYGAEDESPNPIIRMLTLHSVPRKYIELHDFPSALRPFHHHRGYDYNTIFADEANFLGEGGKAYEGYGVDQVRGCVMVLRPDQHVGYIGQLEDFDELERYFGGILQPIEKHASQLSFIEREKVLGAVSARIGNHVDA